ncbi:hypothetical protein KZ483_17275 [Paenibacillus sp. sptzw28]|uniref:hypothetical protein n=1 Tax=Paenibacillus sp. sptzw28 TaxID=715179 RepID=UPI001C6F04CD|nr:hypothetical protein [Paenibacillus sp. sptzw28]QYR19642.1 hypothetical protein KZ483_17275 [Paenibacillus sp. sptzw28]
MKKNFKPKGYNSLSPYFVVKDAQRFVDLIKAIFNASELRRYDMPDGTIMHMELIVDDTVIMLGESSYEFSPTQLLVHVYVPDVAPLSIEWTHRIERITLQIGTDVRAG